MDTRILEKFKQPDPAAKLRALIAKYEAENVFPGSHLAGKIEGMKEALAIVEAE